MPEFLHEVVKKREREMEYRTLMSPSYQSYTVAGTASYAFTGSLSHLRNGQFVEPHLIMPPLEGVSFGSEVALIDATRHSIMFPNVGSWIQSTVVIDTVRNIRMIAPQVVPIAWRLLAGHPCRPNYTWSNNTYTCNGCRATYETDGSEWTRA